MSCEWLTVILTDAVGTLLAAAGVIVVTAWWKALRLALQLKQLADLLRRIGDQTYVGYTGATNMELCAEAEANLSAIEADIEKSAEGVFRLSRCFRFEIDALKNELRSVKHQVVVASLAKRLSSDPVSSRDTDSAAAFELKARRIASRAWWRFWIYLLP